MLVELLYYFYVYCLLCLLTIIFPSFIILNIAFSYSSVNNFYFFRAIYIFCHFANSNNVIVISYDL